MTLFFGSFYTHQPALTSSPKQDICSTLTNGAPRTLPRGRLLALDLGEKRIGLAVSDELHVTIRPLPALMRTSWKKLIHKIIEKVAEFRAGAIVIGFPLRMDGSEGSAAVETRRIARNIGLSVTIPIYLQDERLTSLEAENQLRGEGHDIADRRELVDSLCAVIILRDFLDGEQSISDLSAS